MNWLDRLANGRALWLLIALEVAVLGAENLLTFPLSVPYMRALTGQVYLDFCAFCSGAEIQAQVIAFGQHGRALQWWLLPTMDVLIPLLSCLTGLVALRRFARKHVFLLALPLATMLLDFSENAVIATLLLHYPEPLHALATLLGLLTGIKFIGYATTGLCAMGMMLGKHHNFALMSKHHKRHELRIEPAGWAVDVEAGQSLLEAALAAGIQLPRSCRNGTCRACLCQMSSGQIEYRVEWPGLSLDEKADGYVLPCVALATSNVVLHAPHARRADPDMSSMPN